jgi:hypothetical protein
MLTVHSHVENIFTQHSFHSNITDDYLSVNVFEKRSSKIRNTEDYTVYDSG